MRDHGRVEQARLLYERAVFGGDASALPAADRELDAVEASLCLARGRILHARFLDEHKEDPRELALLEQAAALYRELGDIRGQAESLFWIGCCHQVVREDGLPGRRAGSRDDALALADQAAAIAEKAVRAASCAGPPRRECTCRDVRAQLPPG